MASSASKQEPAPVSSEQPHIADMVRNDVGMFLGGGAICRDIMARKEEGIKKYGMPLQPFNGRSATMDLYQELLDAANYMRQKMYEDSNDHSWSAPKDWLENYQKLLSLVQFVHSKLPVENRW